MRRIYIKPETEEIECGALGIMAASEPKSTEWEMNPDGNNGSNIGDGTGHDPDADDPNDSKDFMDINSVSPWED